MRRVVAVVAGTAAGVAAMLGILQPWKGSRPKAVHRPAAPDPLAQAHRDIEAGRLEDARAILKKEPGSARARALLALADLKDGYVAAAQIQLAQAAALDPELFEIPLFQGHLDMVTGDRAAARRSYTEALKRRPGHARALAGRAAARFELDEPAGAVEDATAALAADPSDIETLFTRAAAYGALGRHEESLRDWTAYLAGRPKDAHAWTNRGNEHDRMGQKAAAIADWRQALKLDPSLHPQLEPLLTQSN